MYKYIGEFKNNEFEGKGTAYYVGGETESGIWKNGKYMGSEAEQNLTPLERKIVGKHAFGIQMVSFWDYLGTCEIRKISTGKYTCVGTQNVKNVYLKLDGSISIISESHLQFSGTIVTKIPDINESKRYARKGTYDFKLTDNRKYWRIEETSRPEDFSYFISIQVDKL